MSLSPREAKQLLFSLYAIMLYFCGFFQVVSHHFSQAAVSEGKESQEIQE